MIAKGYLTVTRVSTQGCERCHVRPRTVYRGGPLFDPRGSTSASAVTSARTCAQARLRQAGAPSPRRVIFWGQFSYAVYIVWTFFVCRLYGCGGGLGAGRALWYSVCVDTACIVPAVSDSSPLIGWKFLCIVKSLRKVSGYISTTCMYTNPYRTEVHTCMRPKKIYQKPI
jgi:hypothetical protein